MKHEYWYGIRITDADVHYAGPFTSKRSAFRTSKIARRTGDFSGFLEVDASAPRLRTFTELIEDGHARVVQITCKD